MPDRCSAELFPDFLVITPARTASTWLFECLRSHPQIVIPGQKEVRYFDAYWRARNLQWYCLQFTRANRQLGGEISPTYALLPNFAIKRIAQLKPDLKVVLLLREPIARAWSHLKHNLRHREINFAYHNGALSTLSVGEIVDNLVHDFTLSFSDYPSILARWSAHFPREQMHIEFYENATAHPQQYLASLVAFLGVDLKQLPLPRLPLHEKINASWPADIPADAEPWFVRLFAPRRSRMEPKLEQMGLPVPWAAISTHGKHLKAAWLPNLFRGHKIELDNGTFRAYTADKHRKSHSAEYLGDLRSDLQSNKVCDPFSASDLDLTSEDARLACALDSVLPADVPRVGISQADRPASNQVRPPRLHFVRLSASGD